MPRLSSWILTPFTPILSQVLTPYSLTTELAGLSQVLQKLLSLHFSRLLHPSSAVTPPHELLLLLWDPSLPDSGVSTSQLSAQILLAQGPFLTLH